MIQYAAVMLMKKQLQGSLCLLLGTVIWGSAFVAQSVGMDHLGPFAFQAIRCALAVIGLLPVIAIADRFQRDGKSFWARWRSPKLWKASVLCGIPLFLASSFQQVGLVYTSAGKSAFLTAMYIVIVPILGLFLHRKSSKMIPVSVVLAVIGLYLLSCMGVTEINKGDLYLLGCAFLFAVQITCIDRFGKEVDGLRLNLLQALICSLLSAVVMGFTERPTTAAIWDCRLPLCYAGFLSMGFAYSLQIFGQRDVEPAAASLIMSLESVFAAVFGWLILHETMTVWETTGCVLVFTAVILSQIQIPAKRRNPKC